MVEFTVNASWFTFNKLQEINKNMCRAYAGLPGFCVHSLTGEPLHVQGGTAGPDPDPQAAHSTLIESTNNAPPSLKTQLSIFRAVERLSTPSILLINWVSVG